MSDSDSDPDPSATATSSASSSFSPSASASESTSSNGDSSPGPFFSQPLGWIIIPVVILIIAGLAASILTYRRRRRILRARASNQLGPGAPPAGTHPRWPGVVPAGRPHGGPSGAGMMMQHEQQQQRGGAGGGWSTVRADEGLNELGEAPPAYELKAEPGRSLATGGAARGEDLRGMRDSVELDDLARPTGSEDGRRRDGQDVEAQPVSPISTEDAPPFPAGPVSPLASPPPAAVAAPAQAIGPPPDGAPPEYDSAARAPDSAPTSNASPSGAGDGHGTSPHITEPPPAVTFSRH